MLEEVVDLTTVWLQQSVHKNGLLEPYFFDLDILESTSDVDLPFHIGYYYLSEAFSWFNGHPAAAKVIITIKKRPKEQDYLYGASTQSGSQCGSQTSR